MVWVMLASAIVSEVFATISMRFSDGFTKLLPSIFVVVGYIAAFTMLMQVLKRGMPVGLAYGIWAACGVALVAVIGVTFLDESLTWTQIAGLTAVIAGVVAMEAGAAH